MSGSFTRAAPLAPNLSDATITPLSYDFTDGVQTITSAAAALFTSFGTDSNGNIDRWQIQLSTLSQSLFPGIITAYGGTSFGNTDVGTTSQGNPFMDNGGNSNSPPGVWTVLPEPSTVLRLVAGLGTLSVTRRGMHRES